MDATTSGFMLVPHGYCEHGRLQLWIGVHGELLPERMWLRCTPQDGLPAQACEADCRDIPVVLERAAPSLRYTLLRLPVIAGCRYHFSLWALDASGEAVKLTDAECRARPDNLADGFNVWYGSCFYGKEDKGALGEAFEALPQNRRPDVSFLGGDQVYLDTAVGTAGWGSRLIPGLSLFKSQRLARMSDADCKAELNRIFSAEYRNNWSRGLYRVLRSGNHHFLAGDHEFWNDYPNAPGFFGGLKQKNLQQTWRACAQALFDAYQLPAGSASGQFAIGDELEFFYLDTCLQRQPGYDTAFTDAITLARVCTWLRALTCPGVLVLPAPLLTNWHLRKGKNFKDKVKGTISALAVKLGFGDHSLADTSQYEPLVQALNDCSQDILILAGDVHYSRLARMELNGKQVVEVVSTALSCLPSAGNRPEKKPAIFPDRPITGIRAEVDYLRVGTSRKKIIGHISDNNFATLNFSRVADGINVHVRCWSVNQRDADGAPKHDWEPEDFLLRRRAVNANRAAEPVREPKSEPVNEPRRKAEALVAEAQD
ncbi:metallophosphoesterase family protein [Microbulbifer pacificus]|uniref:PhoD-like phosphatase metallophosphatase domain-containing protein n=1 Tax=Microbulbifer pacificus TaxID=407164 RepID=A0AAU0MYQ6_9GAMM|nr:hypothetical protein [Microbulbifer pacificus]WOX05238.1 hypothetical protein R5R33_16055 [Microbulbifer pacificus]